MRAAVCGDNARNSGSNAGHGRCNSGRECRNYKQPIDKGTSLVFFGEYARVAYYFSETDETPYYEKIEEWPSGVYIEGKHDYYTIRSVKGNAGSDWKATVVGANLDIELVGCYNAMNLIGDGRNNWLDGQSWQPLDIMSTDSDPQAYYYYNVPVKPGNYEFYFQSGSGFRLGGTFPGFGETGKLSFGAQSIKFTVDEVSYINIDMSRGSFVVNKYPTTYTPPTAAYEQVGKDYPADAVNVHGASLWKVNVDTGTFAANELNVKVNGKTAGEPIVNMNGFTGSVVFGVVLNGVEDDIRSFEVLIDGESASIE